MATYYCDYEGGNDGNTGASFAQRVKTLGRLSAVMSAGDTGRVMASPAPSALGVNVTWTNNSPTLTLASALNASIYNDGAWTASANVTCTTSSTRKEGSNSSSIAVQAAFTTGLAAYYATGTLDLSGYQQIAFWIRMASGAVIGASAARLCLCSDTAGATPVDQFTIPDLSSASGGQWMCFKVNKGSALGSSIKSIALYIDTDAGAQTILIDNVIAVKADGADALWQGAFIGKPNSTGAGGNDSETWYPIRSIVGTTVIIDMGVNSSAATTSRGYNGTGETVAGWMRLTTRTAMSSGNVQTYNGSGSAGSLRTISGGWNRTDMTTQTDETWYDGVQGLGNGLASTGTYLAVSKLNFVNYTNGLSSVSGNNCTWSNVAANNNDTGLNSVTGTNCTWSTITANNNSSIGLSSVSGANCAWSTITANNNGIIGLSAISGIYCTWSTITANNNSSIGLSNVTGTNCAWSTVTASKNGTGGLSTISGANCTWSTVSANNNGTSGLATISGANCVWVGISTSANGTGVSTSSTSYMVCLKSTFSDATPVGGFTAFTDGRVISFDDGNTNGAFKIYCDGATIQIQSSTVHTGGGKAWQFSPTSANRSSTYKLTNVLARIPVVANTTYTVKCWVYRDNVTTLNAGLLVKGGYIAGVTNDVTVTASGSINTWAQETLANFTPTENGVVELYGQVWDGTGTTNSAYFDDVTVNGISITLDRPDWRFGPGPDPLTSGSSGGGANLLGAGTLVA